MAISLGDAWGIFRISLPGQSVLAIKSEFEDCAKRVRVWAGLPVSDCDRCVGEVTPIDHVKLKTYRTDYS